MKDSLILDALRMGKIQVDPCHGHIYSCQRFRNKKLLNGANANGYRVHKICFNGTKYQVRAHRIIWLACNGSVPDGLEIDHIDRDKSNNSINNLRLLTGSGNKTNRRIFDGAGNPNAKLSSEQVKNIRLRYKTGELIREIAVRFGMSVTSIREICTFQSWNDRQKSRLEKLNGVIYERN